MELDIPGATRLTPDDWAEMITDVADAYERDVLSDFPPDEQKRSIATSNDLRAFARWLPSALLAARQERDALRAALTHVADEINAQRKGALGREGYETRRYWAQVEGVARDALAAALAATPEET